MSAKPKTPALVTSHCSLKMGTLAVAGVLLIAQARATVVKLDLPPQPLAVSLREVGRASNTNVLFDPKLASGIVAPALNAEISTEQALRRLLEGSGISYEFLNDDTVVIATPEALTAGKLRLAQAEPPKTAMTTTDAAADRSSVGEAREQTGLSEVVVTAQKRDERLRDVPISITVLSGESLDKSTEQGVAEALGRVPGVVLDTGASGATGGGSQLAMRGVTAPSSYVSGPSPVGYYVDSVPFGFVRSSLVPDANIYDLARVEVLRGPQGTLYGASAQAGVVRILTKDADLSRFELKGRALVSHTKFGGESGKADMALNVPIIQDKLAARAVIGYQDLSGWIDKPTRSDVNDNESHSARVKLNARPAENLSLGLSAWISRSDSGGSAIATDGNGKVRNVADVESQHADFDSYGLTLGYDFPTFSVHSSTSYIDFSNQNNYGQNPEGTVALSRLELAARTFTQEVYFASTGQGAWRWTAGSMYRDGKDRQYQYVWPFLYPADVRYLSKSWAVFGELTRLFFDGKLELTAGLRHFEDTVGQRHLANAADDPPPAGVAPNAEDKFDATTPRVILNWHMSGDTTAYVSYAEGFRSGLHQNPVIRRALPEVPVTQPDTLKNYEIGLKGGLFGNRLVYDAAVYYMDWQDVQLPLSLNIEGIGRVLLVNGASASGMGVDWSLTARPIAGLELGANVSWNDIQVDSDVYSNDILLFHKGDRLNSSIQTTAGASASYSFGLGARREGTFSVSATYRSRATSRALLGTDVVSNQSDPILIARAAFEVNSGQRWGAMLFVDNLANEQGSTFRVSANPGVVDAQYPRPRTIGFHVDYRL